MEIINIIDRAKQLLAAKTPVNEESTKMYLILPFLSFLGYEVNSPNEVIYEYECDMHEKGNRRVDCAIINKNRTPLILIEAKALNEDLNKYWGQVKSYLVSSGAMYALLTNGNEYAVFSQSQIGINFHSSPPFYTFTLTNLRSDDFFIIRELSKINAKPICEIVDNTPVLNTPNNVKKPISLETSVQENITTINFLQQESDFIGKSVQIIYDQYCTFMASKQAKTLAKQEFIKQVCEERKYLCKTKFGDQFFVNEKASSLLAANYVSTLLPEHLWGKAIPIAYKDYLVYSKNNNLFPISIFDFKTEVSMLINSPIAEKNKTEYFINEGTHTSIISSFVSSFSLNKIENLSCDEVYKHYSTYCLQNNVYCLSRRKFCYEMIRLYPSCKISTKYSDGTQVDFFISANQKKTNPDRPISIKMQNRISLTINYLNRALPENWNYFSTEARIAWLASDAVGSEQRNIVCSREIWIEAWGEKPGHFNQKATNEIKEVMKRLVNWRREKKLNAWFPNYGTQRYYTRID